MKIQNEKQGNKVDAAEKKMIKENYEPIFIHKFENHTERIHYQKNTKCENSVRKSENTEQTNKQR